MFMLRKAQGVGLRGPRLRDKSLKNPVNAPRQRQNSLLRGNCTKRFVNLRNHKRSVGFVRGLSSGRCPVPLESHHASRLKPIVPTPRGGTCRFVNLRNCKRERQFRPRSFLRAWPGGDEGIFKGRNSRNGFLPLTGSFAQAKA